MMNLIDPVIFNNRDPEHQDISGLVSAFGFLLDKLDVDSVWEHIYQEDKELSNIRTIVFIDSLHSIHSTASLKAAARLLLMGHREASTSIYFIIRFAKNEHEIQYDFFTNEHIDFLLKNIKVFDTKGWHIKALRLICKARQDLLTLVNKSAEQSEGLLSVLLTYCTAISDQTPVFEKLQSLLSLETSELDKIPVEALMQLSLHWYGHEELFVNLLRRKNTKLAYSLIESLGHNQSINEINIGQIDWWLEWVKNTPPGRIDYFFKQRLFSIIKEKTSQSTQNLFVSEFNNNPLYRDVIADTPLLTDSGLSTDDISEDAISFLLANIIGVGKHALGSLATENFINEKLLPLVTLTKGKMQEAVLHVIRSAGRRHGRRYII